MFFVNKPRKFHYNPRFYKSEEEEPEQHIQFKRIRKSDPPGKMSTLRLVILLLVVVLFIVYLQKQMRGVLFNEPATVTIDEIIVVE